MPLRLTSAAVAALALALPAFAGSVDAVHAAIAAAGWVARGPAPEGHSTDARGRRLSREEVDALPRGTRLYRFDRA